MQRIALSAAALFAAAVLSIPTTSLADAAKKYQVTGTVTELTADKVVITKADGEKWELKRDAAGGDDAKLKMGDKVTIQYTMVVGKVTVKGAGEADAGSASDDMPGKAAASPAK